MMRAGGKLRRTSLLLPLVSVAAAMLIGTASGQDLETRPACELLRNRIEAAGFPPRLFVEDEVIYASEALPSFYERRAYRLVWSGNGGPLPQCDSLIIAIWQADREGLHPEDYHLRRIETALTSLRGARHAGPPVDPRLLVDLDLLLTDAFLIYGFHLLEGRLNSGSMDPEWHIEPSEVDLRVMLEDALSRNRIGGALRDLLPRSPCYHDLREVRALYRELVADGGWPVIPEGGRMKRGSKGDRVRLLRDRLAATGDLGAILSRSDVFDEILEDAVRRFQGRHGLVVDGIVGPNTLAALNETAEERLRRIEVNMERWRWLPQGLGDRFIRVNIASFEMDLFEAGEQIMNMRVMVGREYRRTPVFSDTMTYLVLSPYWNIPLNVTLADKLYMIKNDPDYLTREKIEVLDGWGADAMKIDATTVDWSQVTLEDFSWRLRQAPGPMNALGRIKFMFPNRFNVYLHDTPARELFEENTRAFSSGCIRIEKPIELAEYLLRGYPEWTRPSILAAVEKGAEQTVRLLEPIPIHILYCTAWVEDTGEVHFRNDIYERDRAVADALMRLPPTPGEILVPDEPMPGGVEL